MIKFKHFILLISSLMFSLESKAALIYSKIEHPGCPENSLCSIETGKAKSNWIDTINMLSTSKSPTKIKTINAKIKREAGFPVSGWAKEEAQILPHIIMWDSPCKNHKTELETYYISEFFVKKIDSKFLADYSNLYFPKAYIFNSKQALSSQYVSREDLPSYVSDKGFHYLKSDEGKFYGLIISPSGEFDLSDISEFTNQSPSLKIQPMQEAICTKEQIDLFKKESPSSIFFDGYFCKNLWNITTKKYDNILFGRSCD